MAHSFVQWFLNNAFLCPAIWPPPTFKNLQPYGHGLYFRINKVYSIFAYFVISILHDKSPQCWLPDPGDPDHKHPTEDEVDSGDGEEQDVAQADLTVDVLKHIHDDPTYRCRQCQA